MESILILRPFVLSVAYKRERPSATFTCQKPLSLMPPAHPIQLGFDNLKKASLFAVGLFQAEISSHTSFMTTSTAK